MSSCARYEALLDDTSLALPCEAKSRRSVWHLYVVRHPHRNLLQQALTTAGIGSGLHYPIPVHLRPQLMPTLAIVRAIFQLLSAWQGNV